LSPQDSNPEIFYSDCSLYCECMNIYLYHFEFWAFGFLLLCCWVGLCLPLGNLTYECYWDNQHFKLVKLSQSCPAAFKVVDILHLSHLRVYNYFLEYITNAVLVRKMVFIYYWNLSKIIRSIFYKITILCYKSPCFCIWNFRIQWALSGDG
jgi:hypothetical protein